MDAKVAVLEEVQSRLEMKEDRLITVHNTQTKTEAELKQLRMQTAGRTSESVEVHSAAKYCGGPTKRAKVSRGSENSVRAPSSAACSALLAERDELRFAKKR